MEVYEALNSRISVRSFQTRSVPQEVLRRVLRAALRSPSGGNLQPGHLHVLTGEPLGALKAVMRERVQALPKGEDPKAAIYPGSLSDVHALRVRDCGRALYSALGVAQEDAAGRRAWFARNFDAFGAPALMFCTLEPGMESAQWGDAGMLLQSVMLLLRAEGLDSCPQACWRLYPDTVAHALSLPPDHALYCGLAIGWRQSDHPANDVRMARAALDERVRFIG